jgi:hypothetical protein
MTSLPIIEQEHGCGEQIANASGNSDANCHRKRTGYSRKLVKENPSLCNDCVYNDERFRTPLNEAWPKTNKF